HAGAPLQLGGAGEAEAEVGERGQAQLADVVGPGGDHAGGAEEEEGLRAPAGVLQEAVGHVLGERPAEGLGEEVAGEAAGAGLPPGRDRHVRREGVVRAWPPSKKSGQSSRRRPRRSSSARGGSAPPSSASSREATESAAPPGSPSSWGTRSIETA